MGPMNKSWPRVDSFSHLMHHDPNDLGSVILICIILKPRTFCVGKLKTDFLKRSVASSYSGASLWNDLPE